VSKVAGSFYNHLGAQVKRLRGLRGLTQDELGQRLHPAVTRASVANIEGGKQRVLAHTLFDLATILAVPITELIPDQPVDDAKKVIEVQKVIERELEQKLGLDKKKRKALMARLEANPRGDRK